MLREFFKEGERRSLVWAWFGLVSILAHALFRSWVKFRLNAWYGEFYDLGGAAGEVDSGDTDGLAAGRREVVQLLLVFVAICAPSVFIHPIFKLITNRWVLSWRIKLMESYIRRWRLDDKKIENGAQRVHEDTQRFARGLQTCCVVLLDAVLTLAVFAPLLLQLGRDVKPTELPDLWLLACCAGIAVGGVVVSVILGFSLVRLEVENQKVEADLRKKLVLLEENPAAALCGEQTVGTSNDHVDPEIREVIDDTYSVPVRYQVSWKQVPPLAKFQRVLSELKTNYVRLYKQFAIFSLWLGAYEQAVSIFPYLITAPLLFCEDPSRRITLGKVTQLSNAFSHVFAALNILSDNWVDVTDWLSVLRRLREWEKHVNNSQPHEMQLVSSN